MLYKFKTLYSSFIITLVFSCQSPQSEIIAEVKDTQLTYQEVENILGEGVDKNSIQFKNYVTQWVKNLVWANKAKEELSEDEMNFNQQLEDYKNTLLKYTIENKIILSFSDTLISTEEIKNYYFQNIDDFELKDNIVLYRYVKVDKQNPDLNELKKLIRYKNENEKNQFLDVVEKHKLYCLINEKDWTSFEEIKSLIPINITNDNQFLTHSGYTEVVDKNMIWIIYISDYKLKNNHKPLEIVNEKIKRILIYKKQLEIIKQTEQKILEEAKNNGWVKFY